MIVRQHHSHQSAIDAAKLPDSNLVKSTVKSAEGEQIGKANWCVSADSELGKTRYLHYTDNARNPVYSIDTIHPDGSTRRHIYVTDNFDVNPQFRNEKQDGTEYDYKYEKFAKENPEIMRTPIAHHFDIEKRKQMHLNDFLNGEVASYISSSYTYNDDEKNIINNHKNKIIFAKNASSSEIDDLIKDKSLHIHLAANPNINKSHIDELLKNEKTHDIILNNTRAASKLSSPNFQQIVDGNNIKAKKELIDTHFDKLQPEHYNPLIHSEWGEYIAKYKGSKLNSNHVREFMKNPTRADSLLSHTEMYDNVKQYEKNRSRNQILNSKPYQDLFHKLMNYDYEKEDEKPYLKRASELTDDIVNYGSDEDKRHLLTNIYPLMDEMNQGLGDSKASIFTVNHFNKLLEPHNKDIHKDVAYALRNFMHDKHAMKLIDKNDTEISRALTTNREYMFSSEVNEKLVKQHPELVPHFAKEINNSGNNYSNIEDTLDFAKTIYKYHPNHQDAEVKKMFKTHGLLPSITQQFHNKYKLNEGFLNSKFEKLFITEINKR